MSKAPTILFITGTRIGDCVLTTGVLDHLLEQYPGARLTVAAGSPSVSLFQGAPGLELIIPLDKRKRVLHWVDLYRQVGGRHWDVAVDLRGSAFTWLLRARRRIVTGKGSPERHRVAHLGGLLGLSPPPSPRLWLKPAHEAEAERLVAGHLPLLAIAPASNWAGKRWRAERFAEIARRVSAPGGLLPGAHVVVIAAANEGRQAATVLEAIPVDRRIEIIGASDLLTVAAVLRRASLFIGNDSGLMHISAALGTPTLGLFGPSPVAQYAPWGRFTAVAHTPRDFSRNPTFEEWTSESFMDPLTVDAVEAEAALLLRRPEIAEAAPR